MSSDILHSMCFVLPPIYDEYDVGYVMSSSFDTMLHMMSSDHSICHMMFATFPSLSYAMDDIF